MTTDKEKALELAIGQIEKHFGKGSIMKLGEATINVSIESIPSGAIALDLALGVNGIPRGRITEIFGPESSGKTTLAQHIIAEAQKLGGMVAYIDAEHALDPNYAAHCGMWCIPDSEYAYVEPVFTLPEYRKLGLGKAAVLEGVNRCGKLGAKHAYVLSSQQFYYNIGFYPYQNDIWWVHKKS